MLRKRVFLLLDFVFLTNLEVFWAKILVYWAFKSFFRCLKRFVDFIVAFLTSHCSLEQCKYFLFSSGPFSNIYFGYRIVF